MHLGMSFSVTDASRLSGALYMIDTIYDHLFWFSESRLWLMGSGWPWTGRSLFSAHQSCGNKQQAQRYRSNRFSPAAGYYESAITIDSGFLPIREQQKIFIA